MENENNEEKDLVDILAEETQRKSEFFEENETIDENIPGFDPPPTEEPEASSVEDPESLIDPEYRDLPRKAMKNSGKLVAPIIVNVIDSIVPPLIDVYAKTDNPEQFEADEDDKKNMSEALAAWIGDSNVEMSPAMVFLVAVISAYAGPCISAVQLRKAKKTISEQKQRLDESERQHLSAVRERAEAERKAEEAINELNRIKLENAELQKKAAKAESDAAGIKKRTASTTNRKKASDATTIQK
jgi:hypothetical protein